MPVATHENNFLLNDYLFTTDDPNEAAPGANDFNGINTIDDSMETLEEIRK